MKFITKVHLLLGYESPANNDPMKGIINGVSRMIIYLKISLCLFLFFINLPKTNYSFNFYKTNILFKIPTKNRLSLDNLF